MAAGLLALVYAGAVWAADPGLIPIMTSGTAPSGLASDSSHASEAMAAWRAMDGRASNGWLSSGAALPQWIEYDFVGAQTVSSYCIRPWFIDNPTRSPRSWTLRGSNDGGASWITVDTQSGHSWVGTDACEVFTLAVAGSFVEWRLVVTANGGNTNTGVGVWQLRGAPTATPTPTPSPSPSPSASATAAPSPGASAEPTSTPTSTPMPTPTPAPAGPLVVDSFTGGAADDVHLLAFVAVLVGGLQLFALGAVAMGVWRRG